jgi:hypothetical protein
LLALPGCDPSSDGLVSKDEAVIVEFLVSLETDAVLYTKSGHFAGPGEVANSSYSIMPDRGVYAAKGVVNDDGGLDRELRLLYTLTEVEYADLQAFIADSGMLAREAVSDEISDLSVSAGVNYQGQSRQFTNDMTAYSQILGKIQQYISAQ